MLLLIGAALAAVALFVFWVEPLSFLALLEPLTPQIVYRVQTTLPLIALSFDDGPHPVFTPRVLEILRCYDAKATFFVIGERAVHHPELVSQIKAAGHEVANHYFRNGAILSHSDEEFLVLLKETERAIGTREAPKLFRPPGGVARTRQLSLARENGYSCILGSAYPHDPLHPPVWYIQWLVEKNLVPGTIVILHDGISDPTRSIEALRHILDTGRRRKLKFVSVSELRAGDGKAQPKTK
jgi:peptidoglycan/xylan/chitin deacetylase (PgdA/CDA1 family)